MKKFFVLLALLLAFPAGAAAKPAMWKVEGESGVLFVLGTMHRLPEDASWFDTDMRLMLLEADSLILEVRSGQASDDYLGLLTREDGLGLARLPLRQQVDYDTYQALRARLTAFGVEDTALNKFRPWLAAILLSQLGGEKAGYMATFGADLTVEAFAFENGVPRVGLETSGQQYKILADLPKRSQIYLLEQAVDNVADSSAYYDSLYKAWVAGDVAATEALVLDPLEGNAQAYARLITRRNKAWAKDLAKVLAGGGRHFVAVGTGHLIGAGSVLKLLEKEGYSITRIQ